MPNSKRVCVFFFSFVCSFCRVTAKTQFNSIMSFTSLLCSARTLHQIFVHIFFRLCSPNSEHLFSSFNKHNTHCTFCCCCRLHSFYPWVFFHPLSALAALAYYTRCGGYAESWCDAQHHLHAWIFSILVRKLNFLIFSRSSLIQPTIFFSLYKSSSSLISNSICSAESERGKKLMLFGALYITNEIPKLILHLSERTERIWYWVRHGITIFRLFVVCKTTYRLMLAHIPKKERTEIGNITQKSI